MFKKTLIAGAVAAALGLPGVVIAADDAPPAAGAAPAAAKPEEPKPPYTLTGNFGVYSQYIFRGLTQTGRKPAVQGGFDYAHESGWYAGMWGSNISWLKENASTRVPANTTGVYGEGGSVELDFYGGYKWSLPQDFTLDLGGLYYWYPGDINPGYRAVVVPAGADIPKADTLEGYLALSWKWLTGKYSYSLLDHTFGVAQSRGTGYLDLSANPPLGDSGVTLNLHFGWQKYKGTDPRNPGIGGVARSNDSTASYKDYKVGLSYALPKDFTLGGYYTKANVDVCGNGGVGDTGAGGCTGPYPNNIGKGTGTVFIQKTF